MITLDVPHLDIFETTTGEKRTAAAGKSLALLTYLALTPSHSATRDTLCDLLWGDRSLGESRPLLRQTLWLIKTQINEFAVHADADTVSLACAVNSDVDMFVSAVEQQDLHNAILLYQADFFTGYGAPGAGRFEEWANSERTRLRGLFLNAAETLGRQALNSGRFRETIELAKRMRAFDPHGQASWRLQLEARIASHDVIGARADAVQLEEWLRTEEWEAEPETLATIRAAKRSAPVATDSTHSDEFVTDLVGREREFSQIHEAWLATKLGGPQFIHIVGESGLGKSRLMQDIVARIRASRGKARLIKANFAERLIPFSFASAVAEAVAGYPGAGGIAPSAARTLVSLNPRLSSQYPYANEQERLAPLRVGLALLEVISAVSDENPIALALDDLHWCDEFSRDALTVVASRLSKENAFLISSSRPHYLPGPLRESSQILELQRFSKDDVTTLLSSLGRLPPTEVGGKISKAFWEASEGNPLRLLEAIRFCIDSGLLVRSNEEWACPDPRALFASLQASATIDRRLAALSREEREFIGLMALAGMPTPKDLITRASSQSYDVATATVASLERRGLAIVDNDLWSLAHDSIAETFLSREDPVVVNASHSRLGIALSASQEEQWRRRSIPHLATAAQWEYAAHVVAPLIQAHGRMDLQQSIAALSGNPGSDAVSSIFAALPFRVRHPRLGLQAAVVGLFALLGILGFAALRQFSTTTTPLLVIMARTPDGNTEFREAPLDMRNWNISAPLSFRTARRISGWSSDRLSHATPRPGTNSWAVYSVYPDSGEGDIDLVDIAGIRTRLTRSPHDDRPMSFSPDGNQLLFITSRWSSNGWPDVGIIDLRAGQTRRLTDRKAKYQRPQWSPDGTRIAYNASDSLCVADADGSHARCENVPGWQSAWSIGWIDSHRLYISGNRDSLKDVHGIYDVDRRSDAMTDIPPRTDITIDPSANWAISGRLADGDVAYKVWPSGRYDLAKVVPLDSTQPGTLAFILPTLTDSYVEKISIIGPAEPLAPRIPHQLTAVGLTRANRRVTPGVVRWKSLTPEIAVIDSLGVLTASRAGRAVIEVSAGGWRKSIDTLTVGNSASSMLLDETWNAGVNNRWRLFGNPSPILIQAHDTVAFFNNGDGAFFSGAHLRRTLNARNGLAMDLEVSTPINGTQWQLIMAALIPLSPESRLDEWDHKTGYMTNLLEDQPGCWFVYPSGEGKGLTTRAPWYSSMLVALRNKSFRIDDGSWYRVRVQTFPDGRCGIAINGQAVAINVGTGPFRHSVLPLIEGMSVGTRILVGKVRITTGVPADVDWTKPVFDGYAWYRQGPPH